MYFFKKSVIKRIPPGQGPMLMDNSMSDIHGTPRIPYLIRWTLFGCGWFTIKIHKILISDEACAHNHPWNFLSLILWNGYYEYRFVDKDYPLDITSITYDTQSTPRLPQLVKTWYSPGSILWRPAHIAHRLELEKPCYTLVITFRRVQEWGFFTSKGWVKWFDYQATNTCE